MESGDENIGHVGTSKPVRREVWPGVSLPNGFVHPYTHRTRDGREFSMMRVSIPEGTMLHGLEAGGWQVDAFMNRRARGQKEAGGPVTVRFMPGRPIELWRGAGPARQTMRVNDPWDLCRAIRQERDDYARRMVERHNTEDRAAVMDVDANRGEFIGDGVPRTAGGDPFEPLADYPKPASNHDTATRERTTRDNPEDQSGRYGTSMAAPTRRMRR